MSAELLDESLGLVFQRSLNERIVFYYKAKPEEIIAVLTVVQVKGEDKVRLATRALDCLGVDRLEVWQKMMKKEDSLRNGVTGDQNPQIDSKES